MLVCPALICISEHARQEAFGQGRHLSSVRHWQEPAGVAEGGKVHACCDPIGEANVLGLWLWLGSHRLA